MQIYCIWTVAMSTIVKGVVLNKKEESFGYRFAMLYRINVSIYKNEILKLGFTPSLVPFVAELMHAKEPLAQHELSNLLAIDKGACTRALKELENKGYINRYVNENKKREKFAELTPKGKIKAKELMAILKKSGSVFSKGLGLDERKKILELMDIMIENGLEKINGKY